MTGRITWCVLGLLLGPGSSLPAQRSEALEGAIDWIIARMRAEGLENVRGEPVMVPKWVRGPERAELRAPRYQNLPMLGLGGSIATPSGGLEAEVLVVSSFDDPPTRPEQPR